MILPRLSVYCLLWAVLLSCISCKVTAQNNSDAASHEIMFVTDAAAGRAIIWSGKASDQLEIVQLPESVHERIWLSRQQRMAYFSTPQGNLIQFDLATRQISKQLHLSQQISSMVMSADERFFMVADNQSSMLMGVDASTFAVIQRLPIRNQAGKTSTVSRLIVSPVRKSFIAVMQDIPELWEMSYDEHAEPVYEGWVHDYKMGEGLAQRGPFPARKTIFDLPLRHLEFDYSSTHAAGADDQGRLHVIHLNIRRKLRELSLPPPVTPDQGAVWVTPEQSILFLPLQSEHVLLAMQMSDGETLHHLPFTMELRQIADHRLSAYAWLEGSHTDAMGKTQWCVQPLDKIALRLAPEECHPEQSYFIPFAWSDDGNFALLRQSTSTAIQLMDTRHLQIIRQLTLP